MQSIIRKLVASGCLGAVGDLDLGQSGTSNGHDHQLLKLQSPIAHISNYRHHRVYSGNINTNPHIFVDENTKYTIPITKCNTLNIAMP